MGGGEWGGGMRGKGGQKCEVKVKFVSRLNLILFFLLFLFYSVKKFFVLMVISFRCSDF